jgi:hypothetical protein
MDDYHPSSCGNYGAPDLPQHQFISQIETAMVRDRAERS